MLRGQRLEPILETLLNTGEEHSAYFVLDMLKDRPLQELGPYIRRLAGKSQPVIAAKAIELLGQDGAQTHLPLLEECLASLAPEIRKAAILAICHIQRRHAHERIRQWLASSDPVTREAAIIGAGRFAGPSGPELIWPILGPMTVSASSKERLQAAELLSAIGQSAYANLVPSLLRDPDPAVRIAAIRACGALQAYEQVHLLIHLLHETHLRSAILAALEQMPQASVPVIISTVYGPDFDETLREIVFQIVASIGGPVAREALWALFVSHAPVITRVSAGHALQQMALRGEWRINAREFTTGFRGFCERIQELDQACQEIGDAQHVLWRLLHEQAQLEIEGLFLLLSYQYGIRHINQIYVNFLSSVGVQRANALELLDDLLPRRIGGEVVRVLDDFNRDGSGEFGQLSAATAHRLGQREPWLRIVLAYCTESSDMSLSAYERTIFRQLPDILFLKNVALFDDVSANYLVALAQIAQRIQLSDGDTLFSAGEPGHAMFLICHGTIQVVLGDRELTRQGAGECIGEMALLDGAPRSASCVAVETTELLMLRGADFERLLLNQTSIALALLRTLASRLRQQTRPARPPRSVDFRKNSPPTPLPKGEGRIGSPSLRKRGGRGVSFSAGSPAFETDQEHPEHERLSNLLRNIVFFKRVPLFHDVPEQYLPALAQLTRPITLGPGEALWREGDIGDAMYILQCGTISVQIGGKEINRMFAGDCIGEMSLLDQAPRSASCLTCEATTLLRMAASDFDLVIRSQPSVALALLRTLAVRLRQRTSSNTEKPDND